MSGMLLNLVVAGLVVGFMIGLTGVGSGALMAPMLLLLGIPPATVVGGDLLFGLLTKIVGVGSRTCSIARSRGGGCGSWPSAACPGCSSARASSRTSPARRGRFAS